MTSAGTPRSGLASRVAHRRRARAVLAQLDGVPRLMACSRPMPKLRVLEGCRLRVQPAPAAPLALRPAGARTAPMAPAKVVGVVQSGFVAGRTGIGLNFFIPTDEVWRALGLRLRRVPVTLKGLPAGRP